MSASSTQFYQGVATTTGQLITDSFPLFYLLGGLFLAIFGAMLIYRAMRKSIRKAVRK